MTRRPSRSFSAVSANAGAAAGSTSLASLSLTPVARETLQSRVYDQLKRAISGGVFVPGESVTLRRLAETFGTSIMPVRDAVNRLIAEGALDIMPNRTVIVPRMTSAKFEDLTRLRVMVEGEAALRAAYRISTRSLTALERINEDILRYAEANDVQRALECNRDFHFTIYSAADSEVLLRVIEMLWLQVGPFLVFSMNSSSARWTTKHHLDILRALRSADPTATQQGIIADIKETAQQLLEIGVFAKPAARGAERIKAEGE
jgi:DNA-binding GntR family transcriptional regulator